MLDEMPVDWPFCTFSFAVNSNDERLISAFLVAFLKAFNEKDVEKIVSFFDDHARIDSLMGGGFVTPIVYKSLLKDTLNLLAHLRMDNVIISLLNVAGEAELWGLLTSAFNDGQQVQNNYLLRLKRHGKEWKILKAQFLTRDRLFLVSSM